MVGIRNATPADAGALTVLAERTFRETFGEANSESDMDAHCAENFSLELQLAEITHPHWQTVVAVDDDALVAFGQLRRSTPPAGVAGRPALEIYRLYVDRPWHGRGVAGPLMNSLLRSAVEQGAAAVWLGVWEHNPRAMSFYRKAGFQEVGEHRFVLGTDVQRDVVMCRPVAP